MTGHSAQVRDVLVSFRPAPRAVFWSAAGLLVGLDGLILLVGVLTGSLRALAIVAYLSALLAAKLVLQRYRDVGVPWPVPVLQGLIGFGGFVALMYGVAFGLAAAFGQPVPPKSDILIGLGLSVMGLDVLVAAVLCVLPAHALHRRQALRRS